MRGLVVASVLCVGAGTASPALAHPVIDQAVERFGEGDLEGAALALDRAAEGTDLTRDDLIRLFAYRALIDHALSRRDAVARDLAALASLEPRYAFGLETPPELRRLFSDATAAGARPPAVRATHRREGPSLTFSVVELVDPASLERALRLQFRVDGSWRTHDGLPYEAIVPRDRSVEYYVELVGPGGAVLASDGSRAAPHLVDAEPAEPVVGPPGGVRSRADESDHTWLWVTVGVLTSAAAVTLGVLFLGGGDEAAWSLAPPAVDFP